MAGKTTATKKSAVRRTTPAKAKTNATRKESSGTNRGKPIFRVGTWVTIIILAALVGFTIYLNREKEPAAADATPESVQPSPLFSTSDGNPSSIEIKPADGETIRVARNAENIWAVELPFEAEANQGLVEAAASQISALQVVSPIDNGKPDIFGLDNPVYVITIQFDGGKKHTLEIGDTTPTYSGYYVRIDRDKMLITDLSGIDALLQLGYFPPYLNTPTPTSLPPTETPVPTTEAVTTPEVTVTPTP